MTDPASLEHQDRSGMDIGSIWGGLGIQKLILRSFAEIRHSCAGNGFDANHASQAGSSTLHYPSPMSVRPGWCDEPKVNCARPNTSSTL